MNPAAYFLSVVIVPVTWRFLISHPLEAVMKRANPVLYAWVPPANSLLSSVRVIVCPSPSNLPRNEVNDDSPTYELAILETEMSFVNLKYLPEKAFADVVSTVASAKAFQSASLVMRYGFSFVPSPRSMTSVFVASHSVQVYVISPFFMKAGSTVTSPSFHLCVAGISSVLVVLQAAQV